MEKINYKNGMTLDQLIALAGIKLEEHDRRRLGSLIANKLRNEPGFSKNPLKKVPITKTVQVGRKQKEVTYNVVVYPGSLKETILTMLLDYCTRLVS